MFLSLLLSQVDITKMRKKMVPVIARDHHQTRKACLMKTRTRRCWCWCWCWRFECHLRGGRHTHRMSGCIVRLFVRSQTPISQVSYRWNNMRRLEACYWTSEALPFRVSGNRIHGHRLGTWVDLVEEGGVPNSSVVRVQRAVRRARQVRHVHRARRRAIASK